MKVVFCAVQLKEVDCGRDGICERALPVGSAEVVDFCPLRVKALDVALNR